MAAEFRVLIYVSEYRQIQAWTAKFPNCETGGDLFGLWLDERTAVVQLVLGPGKKCKRTSVSFYQDVEYLEQVGNQLTTKEGLCHIGEWHSHHTLGLTRPSGGDENTVWSNMHRYGIHRFLLFIATINRYHRSYDVDDNDVDVKCFFFNTTRTDPLGHERRRQWRNMDAPKEGTFKSISVVAGKFESPFRSKLNNILAMGSESYKTKHGSSTTKRQGTQGSKSKKKDIYYCNKNQTTCQGDDNNMSTNLNNSDSNNQEDDANDDNEVDANDDNDMAQSMVSKTDLPNHIQSSDTKQTADQKDDDTRDDSKDVSDDNEGSPNGGKETEMRHLVSDQNPDEEDIDQRTTTCSKCFCSRK